MPQHDSRVRFTATLHRPVTPKTASWSFLVLPLDASTRLPTRNMTAVEGRFADQPFRATLEPDGKGSHWLKVPRALREAARAAVGDEVSLEIAPASSQPEPSLPADLRKALAAAPDARAQWKTLTTVARRDWIQWLDSSRKPETRARRIVSCCDMLACGKRRVCCFDRSGRYSKALGAPVAAD